MRKDTKVYDVLHVLLHMADQEEPLTSEFLASMLQTNPVVVRRTLSGLRDVGLVKSSKGRSGGWVLNCNLSQITLLDVYQAVGRPTLFAIGPRNQNATCLVEQTVNLALSDSVEHAETMLMSRFADITLQSLSESFSQGMDHIRESRLTARPNR